MAIDLNFFKLGISSILERNPQVSNSALSGLLKANIINFNGHIQISNLRLHSFQSDGYEGIRKSAKMVYISPYGFCTDLLVSIKRIFAGVTFPPTKHNGDLLSNLPSGRRITIFCSLDGKEADVLSEVDKRSMFVRIFKAVLGCCPVMER